MGGDRYEPALLKIAALAVALAGVATAAVELDQTLRFCFGRGVQRGSMRIVPIHEARHKIARSAEDARVVIAEVEIGNGDQAWVQSPGDSAEREAGAFALPALDFHDERLAVDAEPVEEVGLFLS